MSLLALALVLAASFIHASWNLATKRVGGGLPLAWLIGTANGVLYAVPVLVYCLWKQPTISAAGWWFMLGTGLIHLVYGLVLQRGYREADLSLVYPLARGTGPLLSALGAVVLLGERPSVLAYIGIAFVLAGVFVITSGATHSSDPRKLRAGRFFGIATGACIAAYTIWDKHAVAVLLVPPLLLDYANAVVCCVALAPAAWNGREEIRAHWREHPRELVIIGIFRPLSYILVLSAMVFTPVSSVAPVREVSILIGVFFGARLFAEEGMQRRLVASLLMLAGITAIALG